MIFTKKIDRAFQWAGEKMGAEAKTSMSDDFKNLEIEMALRHDGMDRLQKSMTAYVKWVGRKGETFEDREKGLPASYLGRTMVAHGEDFEPDSEFGGCLTSLGRANERLAGAQERFVADATATWLESLERNLAMLKEYQAARKKLENRRLAYDASITKVQKGKRDDFRTEEELRANRAKYEESSEDVYRRMQDIKDAEQESIRDLTGFLDCELEYHERCAEELRRVKRSWPAAAAAAAAAAADSSSNIHTQTHTPAGRSRSNTARSFHQPERVSTFGSSGSGGYADDEPDPMPVRMPLRSTTQNYEAHSPERAVQSTSVSRNNSFQRTPTAGPRYGSVSGTSTPQSYTHNNGSGSVNGANAAAAAVASLRSGLRPTGRMPVSTPAHAEYDASDSSGRHSPEYEHGERSTSPATSYGSGVGSSLSRSTSNLGIRKAPPPPPPTRAKKPPPPPPAPRRAETHY